jgi:pimeloyl-ACP methyl ester carboxylesterase
MIFKCNQPCFWLYSIFVLSLAIFACNFPTTSDLPTQTPSVSPTPFLPLPGAVVPSQAPIPFPTNTPPTRDYQPVFKTAPCAFPIPSGYSPECGYLVVPENRASPTSTLIQLHVAIFHSTAEGPSPDPVVHLAGGPGSSSLDVARYLFDQGLGAILDRRDFILFDQRGTGYSLPRLDCPERDALTPALLSGALSADESLQKTIEAFQHCRDRLSAQGIDLSAYNSAASAADLNDLRLALGYEQLNLYGDSYGTRLALTVMRDFPQAVRSVVLDSTYPLEVNLYTALAPNAERAFNILFDECAVDPICNAAYPDLRTVFYNLVDQLNANPVRVSLSVGGIDYPVLLDGNRLIDVLFVGLYNPIVTANMPRMIYQIQRGEYSILRERLRLYFDTSSALGMGTSVQCAEEVPFNSFDDVSVAAQGVQPGIAAFFPKSVQYLFALCQDWTGRAPNPRDNQPVTSDIPALILAGEFDPITPPVWGQMTASHLSHAYFYEFRGNGHWVTRSSRCALSMAMAFWDSPAAASDATCLQSLEGINFVP